MGIYENRELEPTVVKSIARELVVDEKDVVEMNRRMGGDKSLNVAACDDSDEEKVDFVVDSRQNIEENLGRRQENALKARVLRECLNEMGEREQYIIKSRMLTDKPVTLEEIGVKFGISRERVRQIEKKAFEKLSALVKLELAQKCVKITGQKWRRTMAAAEQEKGFVFKGRFSKSIDLNLLKENMERRLAFVRSLKPDNESILNAWNIARQNIVQHQN